MFLPIAPAVPSVGAAVALAALGLPLAAVSLPPIDEGPEPSTAPHVAARRGSPSSWAQSVLATLAELNAASANTSNAMSMAVSLDACAVQSDSLARFAAYASVIWGAQALWWEGVGRCAPQGSEDFALIASINRRLSQWAEPLFLKAKNEAVYLETFPGIVNVARYRVDAVYSTSSLELPPLQGVAARRPAAGALIEAMDEELVALHIVNTSATGTDKMHALLFLSTAFDVARGGAAVRQLSVRMRSDVKSTRAIEPDLFQGWGAQGGMNPPPGIAPSFFGRDTCFLSWWGHVMPLQLAGGSAQLVEYTILTADTTPDKRASGADAAHYLRVGRSPPRRARG